MLLFNPMLVVADAGFQLSFLAVLGMIYLYPIFDKWLANFYENKIIFYSLGNFIFDQSPTGPTSRGLVVKLSLAPNSVTYDLLPISIVNQQAALLIGEERQVTLDSLNVRAGTIVAPR